MDSALTAVCAYCEQPFERWRWPSTGSLTTAKCCGPKCAIAQQKRSAAVAAVVPRRRCSVCGKLFDLWRVKTTAGQHGAKWTRAKTCGRSCQNILRSTAMENAHERARLADPEAYERWIKRDYHAMAAARHSPDRVPKQANKLGNSKRLGKGWKVPR